MQIDGDAAIERKCTDKSVLHLQVVRFESAAKSRDDDHDGGECQGSPVVRKKSPRSGCGGEPTKIGMDSKQRAIRRVTKQIFPARAGTNGVGIEDDGTEREKDTSCRRQTFIFKTLVEELAEVNADKMQADEQARQEAKTAENDFFRDDSSCQEDFCAHEPEDCYVVPGIVERNSGKHQRGSNHAQDNKSLPSAFGDGQLGQEEFERADDQKREIGEFRLDGLKLHDAEE